ncbi:MAG: hypothetical protein A2096_05345 [Spirochaetes bacterium GWF1_41_5]|nr:MAG: hypothetical protein A2096_05345 [Spirochaetes bacterium GWF1_41_5]HBE04039.1 hypothetical protein [Spirochaetia bacterium]
MYISERNSWLLSALLHCLIILFFLAVFNESPVIILSSSEIDILYEDHPGKTKETEKPEAPRAQSSPASLPYNPPAVIKESEKNFNMPQTRPEKYSPDIIPGAGNLPARFEPSDRLDNSRAAANALPQGQREIIPKSVPADSGTGSGTGSIRWENQAAGRRLVFEPGAGELENFPRLPGSIEIIVKFSVNREGILLAPVIIRSSGQTELDAAVIRHLRRYVFEKVPEERTDHGWITFLLQE